MLELKKMKQILMKIILTFNIDKNNTNLNGNNNVDNNLRK